MPLGLPARTTKTIVDEKGALSWGKRFAQSADKSCPLIARASTSWESASVTTSASSPSSTARACLPEPPCDCWMTSEVPSCSALHFLTKAALTSS
jgi:hypothetical protein